MIYNAVWWYIYIYRYVYRYTHTWYKLARYIHTRTIQAVKHKSDKPFGIWARCTVAVWLIWAFQNKGCFSSFYAHKLIKYVLVDPFFHYFRTNMSCLPTLIDFSWLKEFPSATGLLWFPNFWDLPLSDTVASRNTKHYFEDFVWSVNTPWKCFFAFLLSITLDALGQP